MLTNGVEIMATHCNKDIIRPLVGVQVLQYCVPLYVRDVGETLATKAAPATLVRARKAWGPNELTHTEKCRNYLGVLTSPKGVK